jgi:VanZ family protein
MAENSTKHWLKYWLPVLLYCTAIFIQSSFPTPLQTPGLYHIDKVVHFFAYALLGILFVRALRNSAIAHRESLVFILAVLFAGIYGAADEWHQSFVPGRTPDGWDLLADVLGGWFGVFVYQRLLKRNPGLRSL